MKNIISQSEIPDYSRYIFYSDGSILAKNWKNSDKRVKMTPALSGGYLKTVFVTDSGVYKSKQVHRMIALAFIPNPENKPEVNHINGVKTDNRVENLEWVTHSENIIHSFKNKLQSNDGEKNPFSILTEKEVIEIRSKFKPRKYTREMLSKEYGVKACTIKDVVLRKSWKHI